MVKGKSVVCPQCGRRFASQKALAQHRLAAHAQPAPALRRAAKRVVRSKRAGSSLSVQTVNGNDRIGHWEIPNNAGSGSLFSVIPIAPYMLNDTRLQAHSLLWARWRPVALKVRVSLAGASTTFGSVCVGWSPEPDFSKASSNSLNAQRVLSLKPSKEVRAWETVEMVLPVATDRKWYHTTGMHQEASHGCLVVTIDSAFGGYTGKIGFTAHLMWTVQFEGVELDSVAGPVSKDTIQADSGWSHFFTTSDSGWDATRLTFKESSGGSMVPFSSAKPNFIYEPDSSTRVHYVREDGKEADAKYFVRIQDYSTPGLALCASIADAKAYIQTGDTTKLLPYKSASSWVTPDDPKFVGKPAGSYTAVRPEEQDLQSEIERLRQQLQLLEAGNEKWEVLGSP
ncbi:putative capsid protein [Hubei diptera virus 13]|uniref:putative capsid protein n=1 Tax=Hubei diptera virus 13 TaxID=1922874 RepID=UPI000909F13B|nr:putative capsid protein [Hubei diptera virus 13]APG75650.1 hypothetical protein [Hubei diptera virus 13]APG75817.1 putative capsid protein [Hubei diptera virus 13]